MSKHLATVARKNFLLTGRNLGTDPDSEVGGHMTGPVGLREGEGEGGRDRDRCAAMNRNYYNKNETSNNNGT